MSNEYSLAKVKEKLCWSKYLEKNFGKIAAWSFAVGSDMLLNDVYFDLEELSTTPKNTHIGELEISTLEDLLPEQFLPDYDYDFLYRLKCRLIFLQNLAKNGNEIVIESVLDEIIIFLCNLEAEAYVEDTTSEIEGVDNQELKYLYDWIFNFFDFVGGFTDLLILFSNEIYIEEDNKYHFNHWCEKVTKE